MSAKNDITGDAIASKANSKSYRDNYENIFAKKATEKKVELDGGFVIPKAMTDAEQAVEPVAWLITHPGSQPMECPYPCGWNNLYSIIVQKGAYLAQSTLGDDAITSHQRNEMVRIIDFARTLCEWGKNTRPPKRKPLSDDDIARLWGEKFSGESEMLRNFARAIEKAHGISDER